MVKTLTSIGLAAAFAIGMSSAQAVTINNGLTAGVLNTVIDESRETYVDGNANGVFDAGDVVFGYVRISDFQPSGQSAGNDVYAIFSQQVSSISGTTVNFTTTTVAGLTLATLTGDANTAGGIFALYDRAAGFSVDLVNAAPAGATDMTDYLDFITGEGTLRLVGGLSDSDDFLRSVSSLAGQPNAGLVGLPTSITVASTAGALSVLYNNTNFGYADLVPVSGPPPLVNIPPVNAEIAVSSGTVAGSFGANPDPQTWLEAGGTFAQCSVQGVDTACGFIDKNNFQVIPTAVPEPGTLALIGISLLGVFGARRRKN